MTRKSIHLALSAVVAAAAIPATTALAGKAAKSGVTAKNNRDETIRVLIDGELKGMLPAGGQSSFMASEGRHKVRLEDIDGEVILARKISVERGERSRVRLGGADGKLVIENESEVHMTVKTVDRQGQTTRRRIAPGTQASVPVSAGEVDVSTYHTWFDIDRRVSVDDLRLEPGEVEHFVIEPLEEALVQVDNTSDQPISLSIEGEYLGRVAPESVGFVMAPVGEQVIELASLGLDAGVRRVQVRAVSGARIDFSLRTGDILLVNRSVVMAQALIDGTDVGVLRPGESLLVEIPVGSHELTFVSRNGDIVQGQTIRVMNDQREHAAFRLRAPNLRDEDVASAGRKSGDR
jgi:hypothetical protein